MKTEEKIAGATGLGRIIREQIDKWNQMTAMRYPGGRHQKCPAILRGKSALTKMDCC